MEDSWSLRNHDAVPAVPSEQAFESSPENRGTSIECSKDEDRSSTTSDMRNSSKRKRVSPSTSRRSRGEGASDSDQDKKTRREAANSNERRRMMSINNGFLSLQTILPNNFLKKGEKMSKAAVLQSTVDYINKMAQDHADLQVQNQALVQKIKLSRPENGAESNDESGDLDISAVAQDISTGAQDLNALVEHWKGKYNRERNLRAQTIEEFRRLILEAMQCCPSGISMRDTYNAALLRRSKSPTPGYESDFSGPIHQSGQFAFPPDTCLRVAKSEFDSSHPVTEEREAPVISIPDAVPQNKTGVFINSRKGPTSAGLQDKERKNLKPLTGFDILYQAITFSENLDGNEPECGQVVAASPNKRSKKRRK